MADITMCRIDDCPKAQSCRRSPQSGTPVNGYFQSYFVDDPRHAEGVTDSEAQTGIYCLQYWPADNLED